jgi:hypothetical protein
MIPPEFEAAADVCFAVEAVKQAGATGRRQVLLEELVRRTDVLRQALTPKADPVFHAGVHRSRRALQVLALGVEDWIWAGADPCPDEPAMIVVDAAKLRVGRLMQMEAPAGRKGGGEPIQTRSTSKITCANSPRSDER